MTTSTPTRLALAALLGLVACGGRPTSAPAPEAAAPEAAAGRRLPADGLVQPEDLGKYTALPDPPLLVDVRTVAENESVRIPGSLLVPVQDLQRRLPDLEAGRERGVILYCRSGRRAGTALSILERAGFSDLAVLDGSMQRWEQEGRPVERGPAPK